MDGAAGRFVSGVSWMYSIYHKNPLGYAPNQMSPLLAGTVFYLSFTIFILFL